MLGWTFRTRNPDRLSDADRKRWAAVAEAIAAALASARREHDGLGARHAAAPAKAAFLYDAEPGDQHAIRKLEAELLAAEARLKALTRQTALLQQFAGTGESLRAEALADT